MGEVGRNKPRRCERKDKDRQLICAVPCEVEILQDRFLSLFLSFPTFLFKLFINFSLVSSGRDPFWRCVCHNLCLPAPDFFFSFPLTSNVCLTVPLPVAFVAPYALSDLTKVCQVRVVSAASFWKSSAGRLVSPWSDTGHPRFRG